MLPYSKHVSSDTPSMEEMREVTHVRELRPSVCDQWNRDEVGQSQSRVLSSVNSCDEIQHTMSVQCQCYIRLSFYLHILLTSCLF